MKNILAFTLITCSFLSLANAEALKIDATKSLSKFMKPAIEAKDAPATCWFLGQVHGYALALRNSGNTKGAKLFDMVKDGAGKCGGKNTMNLSETFTREEWSRLSDLQKKIENFNL